MAVRDGKDWEMFPHVNCMTITFNYLNELLHMLVKGNESLFDHAGSSYDIIFQGLVKNVKRRILYATGQKFGMISIL